ncbi:hypothetical protein SS05631_c14460 [Sinorhizobium sp. CCBAU 05631]|nr:hypothetical protein SS05631_c14460 [Sinorhizobium sp. CCBAU 05631]
MHPLRGIASKIHLRQPSSGIVLWTRGKRVCAVSSHLFQ